MRRSHCRITRRPTRSSLAVRTPEPTIATTTPARTIIDLGMDVHKDSITIVVLPGAAKHGVLGFRQLCRQPFPIERRFHADGHGGWATRRAT